MFVPRLCAAGGVDQRWDSGHSDTCGDGWLCADNDKKTARTGAANISADDHLGTFGLESAIF